ncbi:MAG TPA: LysR substrate-binding domain-containing protein [Usitatibacter sp.]|nr:LysR substrate-binding domain-containing protein [Usitatibacter sp.]
MLNLRAVDLNLLPVFEAAYEERSLSKAAVRLSITQPAVSHALSRLRAAFRDELFIRQARGMRPTPVADAVYAKLAEALSLVRQAVSEGRGFDPKTSERRFSIAIPHPMGPLVAVRLLETMKAAAPGIVLAFSTRSRPIELEHGLVTGRFDLAVDWMPLRGHGLEQEHLLKDSFVAVARRGHPATRGPRTRAALARQWQFVALRPRVELEEHPVEGVREWARSRPEVVLEVSEFLEVLAVARQSDLIGLVPKSLALAARPIFDIQLVHVTSPPVSFDVRMAWRAGRMRDVAHDFLRTQARAVVKEVIRC